MRNFDLPKFIATFFYLGTFPYSAGSLASAYGGLVCYLIGPRMPVYFIVLSVSMFLGFWASGKTERAIGKKDPACIVIDEFCGALLAFFMLPMTPSVMWTAFFLFRAFDMFKIYPACVFEKRTGSFGVMMDDVMAGIYTNLVMQIAVRLVGIV